MSIERFVPLTAFIAVALFACSASSQQYASSVLVFNQGLGNSGIFATANILGGPDNQSGLFQDVLSLGQGGDVTLGFNVAIVDGPGVDFTVFENAFELLLPPNYTHRSGDAFAELAYVEVSTNGIDFARFPTSFNGVPVAHTPFQGTQIGSAAGFAGGTPGVADVGLNLIDPSNAAISGGDAFDLADLAADPLVTLGLLDLGAINFVRLIDVVAGVDADGLGNIVFDDFGNDPLDSTDIDAVCAINHSGNVAPLRPTVAISRNVFDEIEISFDNPAGFAGFDPSSFVVSANTVPLSLSLISSLFRITSLTPTGFVLTSNFAASSLGFDVVVGAAIANLQAKGSSDTFYVQS